MHPMLKPALRRGWRDRETVQFGVAPAHAVVLGPVDTATGSFLTLLDGTRGAAAAARGGRAAGAAATAVPTRWWTGWRGRAAGRRHGGGPAADAVRGPAAFDRLRPDLASLSVRASGSRAARCGGWPRGARCGSRCGARAGSGAASPRPAVGRGGRPRSRCGRRHASSRGTWRPAGCPPSGSASAGTRAAAQRLVRRAVRPGPYAAAGGLPVSERASPGCPWWSSPRGTASRAYAPDPVAAEPLHRRRTSPSVRRGGRGHRCGGPAGAARRYGLRGLPASCGARTREPAWPRLLAQWRSGRAAAPVPACDLRWPRRSPGSPPPMRWPSSTADCRRAPGRAGMAARPALCWRAHGADRAASGVRAAALPAPVSTAGASDPRPGPHATMAE